MGNENTGRKISRTVGHRKKLSDISNTPSEISNTPILLKSRIHDENAQLAQKRALAQLQEELANVNRMLAEKEEILAESKRCMERLWFNYCRKSKQNDEIILHNSQLYRDLTQARDQLKVLQHENAQMSAVYKASKLEMQEKLNDALEQVNRLRKLVEASSLKQASDKKCPPSIGSGRALCCEVTAENPDSIHSKSLLRKRERKSYKEPSLKVKLRQTDQGSMHQIDFTQNDNNLAISEPAEAKRREVVSIVAVSASCKSEVTNAVENRLRMTASQTEKDENMSKHEVLPASTNELFEVMTRSVDNGAHITASKQCTEKGEDVSKPEVLPTSTRESFDRPRRRAASSVGSYKEPSLNTKMRRAK